MMKGFIKKIKTFTTSIESEWRYKKLLTRTIFFYTFTTLTTILTPTIYQVWPQCQWLFSLICCFIDNMKSIGIIFDTFHGIPVTIWMTYFTMIFLQVLWTTVMCCQRNFIFRTLSVEESNLKKTIQIIRREIS